MARARVMDPRGAMVRSWRHSSASSAYSGAIYPTMHSIESDQSESEPLFATASEEDSGQYFTHTTVRRSMRPDECRNGARTTVHCGVADREDNRR